MCSKTVFDISISVTKEQSSKNTINIYVIETEEMWGIESCVEEGRQEYRSAWILSFFSSLLEMTKLNSVTINVSL